MLSDSTIDSGNKSPSTPSADEAPVFSPRGAVKEVKEMLDRCGQRLPERFRDYLIVNADWARPTVKLVSQALDSVRNNVSSSYTYHGIDHTNSVCETVLDLADRAGCSFRDMEILWMASAKHDEGFSVNASKNEPIAANELAAQMRLEGAYTEEEIEDAWQAIVATQMNQNEEGVMVQVPRGRLSPWLLDADLNNFGTTAFKKSTELLIQELFKIHPVEESHFSKDAPQSQVAKFLGGSLKMMEAHHFQTEAARALFNDQKEANRRWLADVVKLVGEGNQQRAFATWQGGPKDCSASIG